MLLHSQLQLLPTDTTKTSAGKRRTRIDSNFREKVVVEKRNIKAAHNNNNKSKLDLVVWLCVVLCVERCA